MIEGGDRGRGKREGIECVTCVESAPREKMASTSSSGRVMCGGTTKKQIKHLYSGKW